MDLSTVVTKIDTHQYLTAKDFLVDIDLICNNALEYNPDKDPGGEEGNYCIFQSIRRTKNPLIFSKIDVLYTFWLCLLTSKQF